MADNFNILDQTEFDNATFNDTSTFTGDVDFTDGVNVASADWDSNIFSFGFDGQAKWELDDSGDMVVTPASGRRFKVGGGSGNTANSNATVSVENNASFNYIQLLGGSAQQQGVLFGDDDPERASVLYDHDTGELLLRTGGNNTAISVKDNADVYFNNRITLDNGTNFLSNLVFTTYTPVLRGDTTVGTNAYDSQQGIYFELNSIVVGFSQVRLDGTAGALDSTGNLSISLPVTVSGSILRVPAVVNVRNGGLSVSNYTGFCVSGTDDLDLLVQNTDSIVSLDDTDFDDDLWVDVVFIYQKA